MAIGSAILGCSSVCDAQVVEVTVAAQPPPPPPAPEINFQYFHDQLSPFGTWVEVPGLGMCWRPASAVIRLSPEWRPYYDNGQWVQTDNGLFWQSDYAWGDIPFHYGRWTRDPAYGWIWAPDYVWGPSWVFWRHAEGDGAVGWAALPPGAVFVEGGFMYHGARVGVDFEFGLGEEYFTFVEFGHFHERFFRMRGREFVYHVERERMHGFYGRSVVRNEFHRDEHGRFVNHGIGRDRMEHLTHVEHAKMEVRNPVGNREKAAARPAATASAPAKPAAATVAAKPAGATAAAAPKAATTEAKPAAPAVSTVSTAPKAAASAPSSPVSKVYQPPVSSASSPQARPAAASAKAPQKK